ncbi:MAG TPA: GTP cyclohydrolase MptA [Synergistales bacterium]|jgi:GTP cyclohydrolase-4|nr:GTP cyclohydrolase MptA [Synergistales bacterium]MDI9393272.1 GTP cyclohydrolase MptA [Synergistota bacterium]NLV65059.1 GTP cyclohydrolase I FolE2 [Synergistaceae bacterium]HRV71780.1 GTP cyclohydrolase MptA [Thermovirgaceae bacterium]MDD3831025.1 GTP cyclohydrolase MptA [Synergistales bacterium]
MKNSPVLQRAYLLLGANLGDRQGNILRALQLIGGRNMIEEISSFYETMPAGHQDQPWFINLACRIETDMDPSDLHRFVKSVELLMGRDDHNKGFPRPIDIDVLFYETASPLGDGFRKTYPGLGERAFAIAPLAEIAFGIIPPGFTKNVGEIAKEMDMSGIRRVENSLRLKLERDIQQENPRVPASLSRVGVTGLKRILRIENGGKVSLFYAEMDLFAWLGPNQAGVHMSRFSDVLEDLVEEITLEASPNIETLAGRLARKISLTQQGGRSEVVIRAKFPIRKITPISGKNVEELYTFIGISACAGESQRTAVGVEVEGMTVCPCAQDMVRSHSRKLLLGDGFSEEETDRILGLVPLASHNQRGRGTLLVGGNRPLKAEHLVHILEASMSSETYELLKRPDEFFVVNKAHKNPMFAEDVVREVLRNLLDMYPDLHDDTFVLVRQENLESIHQHNAFAERSGTLKAIRSEIKQGFSSVEDLSLQEWLKGGKDR